MEKQTRNGSIKVGVVGKKEINKAQLVDGSYCGRWQTLECGQIGCVRADPSMECKEIASS
jgi:hypothetical protein